MKRGPFCLSYGPGFRGVLALTNRTGSGDIDPALPYFRRRQRPLSDCRKAQQENDKQDDIYVI
ncbi:hypothetical protein TcasGA2_TC014912 [Tribolium castaneum]|uniref:Uncharacterized protein n=1 Tax=Tribolium castaneum TaxID=7070 RepID=D2A406_TRICA|nr:hypothetical protein TcasGA2_TC014912 [Tribolium castaneum]